MLGLLLGGLGAAASGAGLSTLGAGLTAAGSMFGGAGGIPGMGGAGGMPGAPGASPFGMAMANLVTPKAEDLGTVDGWKTSVTPEPTDMQKLLSGVLKQVGQGGAQQPMASPLQSMPTPQQRPADISQLMQIINKRQTLGS